MSLFFILHGWILSSQTSCFPYVMHFTNGLHFLMDSSYYPVSFPFSLNDSLQVFCFFVCIKEKQFCRAFFFWQHIITHHNHFLKKNFDCLNFFYYFLKESLARYRIFGKLSKLCRYYPTLFWPAFFSWEIIYYTY